MWLVCDGDSVVRAVFVCQANNCVYHLAMLQEAPAGSLQVTGVLGLAALVWGLYQLQGPPKQRDLSEGDTSSTARPATRHTPAQHAKPPSSSSSTQVLKQQERLRILERRLNARGNRCMSLEPPSLSVLHWQEVQSSNVADNCSHDSCIQT